MKNHVFISYSSKSVEVADALCQALEVSGVRCWIAPRDIPPGALYPAAIIEGIDEAGCLLLLYTRDANESPQVIREVERAVSKGKAVIPFRIENVPLSPAMEFLISTPHWLDAFEGAPAEQFPRLIRAARDVLGSSRDGADLVDMNLHPATEIRFRLRFEEGPRAGEVLELVTARALIGRASSADVCLEDPRVSRAQCAISWDAEAEAHIFEDWSMNGSQVNGETVRRLQHTLSEGDRIAVGQSVFVYEKA